MGGGLPKQLTVRQGSWSRTSTRAASFACRKPRPRRLPVGSHPTATAPSALPRLARRCNAAPGGSSRTTCDGSHFPSGRASSLVAAAAAAAEAGDTGLPRSITDPAPAARVVLVTACIAMAMAAVHRVSFSVLALPIQAELGLSSFQMGQLQSALLMGYVVGQVPCGVLADRVGGAHLAAAGLFLWSFVCLLFRAVLGAAQSCIMPAVAAAAARWFPPASRSRSTSMVYSSFSVGTVVGLASTPLVAERVGWGNTFVLVGLAGMVAAVVSSLALPSEAQAPRFQQARLGQAAGSGGAGGKLNLDRETLLHMSVLCLTHSVISCSFFILQAWIPSFLASVGMSNLTFIGLLSSLPWLATAVVAVLAGEMADRLQARHRWSALRVRHLMQALAAGGTALSLVPLAIPGVRLAPCAAAAALTAAVACQGMCYAGFHSYVPEVAPDSTGLVLSITNTCGTLVGIAGNLLTGVLAATSSGYAGVFALTVVLQAVCVWAWLAGAHGRPLRLRSA